MLNRDAEADGTHVVGVGDPVAEFADHLGGTGVDSGVKGAELGGDVVAALPFQLAEVGVVGGAQGSSGNHSHRSGAVISPALDGAHEAATTLPLILRAAAWTHGKIVGRAWYPGVSDIKECMCFQLLISSRGPEA